MGTDNRNQQKTGQSSVPRKSSKGGTFSIYLSSEVAALVDRVSTQEYRSFSNTVSLLLAEALRARGVDVPEDDGHPSDDDPPA